MAPWCPEAGEVVWADTFALGLMRARVESVRTDGDALVFKVKDCYGPTRLEVGLAALQPVAR